MATMSVTARSDRPISRWISWVRPDCLPLAASRPIRSADDPGSSEYSAVTQPFPLPRIHGGTRSSTEAVHSTLVFPMETSTDPGANSVKSRTKLTGPQVLDRPSVLAPARGSRRRSQRVPPPHGGLRHRAAEGARPPRPARRRRRPWATGGSPPAAGPPPPWPSLRPAARSCAAPSLRGPSV